MNGNTEVTRRILNISISIAVLVVALCAVCSVAEVRRVSGAAAGYLTESEQQSMEIRQNAGRASRMLSEALLFGVSVGLEQRRILNAEDAKMIRDESVAKIKSESERWGKIAEAVALSLEKEHAQK